MSRILPMLSLSLALLVGCGETFGFPSDQSRPGQAEALSAAMGLLGLDGPPPLRWQEHENLDCPSGREWRISGGNCVNGATRCRNDGTGCTITLAWPDGNSLFSADWSGGGAVDNAHGTALVHELYHVLLARWNAGWNDPEHMLPEWWTTVPQANSALRVWESAR